LDAEFLELVGLEREEGLPGGELVGEAGEATADELEKCRDVGNERRRSGDLAGA